MTPRNRDYNSLSRFATLTFLVMGVVSCDSPPNSPVSPDEIGEPNELAVVGPGDFGDVHNATLAAALSELEIVADTLGPLSESEALTFSRPAAEDFLDSEGFTPTSGSWESSIEDVELGEEVVEEHGGSSGLLNQCIIRPGSCQSVNLLDSLLAVIAGGPMSLNDLDSKLQDLEALAQDSLSGTFYLDGFTAVMSVARSSAEYWLDPQTQAAWNAVLEDGGSMLVVLGSSAATDCGWKTLLGDVSGATGGFLRSFGNWVWAGIGGALGSTAAYTLCKADEQLG